MLYLTLILVLLLNGVLLAQGWLPPYQYTPIDHGVSTYGVYNDNQGGNIFQSLSWAQNIGTRPVVAVFGEGIASGPGSQAWGGNFVAYATASGASAHGVEINFGSMASGGHAYGVVVVAAGPYPTNAYVQMQSNTLEAQAMDGIVFNGWGPLIQTSGTLIRVIGHPHIANGIDLSSANISGSAILLSGMQDIRRNGVGIYQRLSELESRLSAIERRR